MMRKNLFALCLCCGLVVHAQQITVRGVVYEKEGAPVAGASVRSLHTRQGTITDVSGSYSLKASLGDTLEVSFLGMETYRQPVRSEIMNITLLDSEIGLDEVVVVAFGVQSKSSLAASVSSVKEDEIAKVPAYSVEQSIQGKMAGVRIVNASGVPGGSVVARVRGASSFSAGNDPLFVIDGVPVNSNTEAFTQYGDMGLSGIADINPADIASVEVLKDASASALYGSRASNGVILITTKKGSYNQSKVQFNAYYGIQSLGKKVKFTNARDWLTVQNEARANYNADMGFSEGDDGYQSPLGDPLHPAADVDWLDEILRGNAAIQSYQVAFSGGNDRTRSYVSGGYFRQEGLQKTSDYKKYNFRTNLDSQILPVLKVGTDLSLTYMQTNRVYGSGVITSPWSNAVTQRPDEPVYDENGDYYPISAKYNPVQVLAESDNKTRKARLIGSVYGELKLYEGLTFKTRFGIDVAYLHEHNFDSSRSIDGQGTQGAAKDGRAWNSIMLVENFLNYENVFGKLLFNALLGQSYQRKDADQNYVTGNNFPSDALHYLESASVIDGGSSSWTGSALSSLFARFRGVYDDKYIAELSIRRDGSSKFSPENRFGVFPSLALAWVIDKERFFPENEVLNGAKLRVSYGLTGNQEGISDFAFRSLLASGYGYNDLPGFAVVTKSNENLRWEKTRQFDSGIDLEFFHSRVFLTADYFHKHTVDLLMSRSLASTTGFSSMIDNIGSVRNEGIELSVLSHNFRTRDFSWTTSLNLTHEWNEILALNKTPEGEWIDNISGTSIQSVGHALNSFYLLKSDGVYQTKEEIPQKLWEAGVRPGDMRYEDFDKDGDIDDNDRQIMDAPEPKLYGGFDNMFTYKEFDLNISTYFALGGKLYADWLQEGAANLGYTLGSITQKVADSRWTGPNTSTDTPRAIYGPQGEWNTRDSDRFYENASFLKVKDVTLGYTLPKELTVKAYIDKLRLYLKAENLLTVTKYPGYDPEVLSGGSSYIDSAIQPQPRSFIFGINLTL